MSLTSIGVVGVKSVGAGLVIVSSDIEISCPQVWFRLDQGGIGERRGFSRGSCSGSTSGALKVWTTVQNDLMSNYAHPIFPLSWIGAGPSPICNLILSKIVYPLVPKTMSSCDMIASASGSGGVGLPARTPSSYQIPDDWVGSGIGWCRCWGDQTIWCPGTRIVSRTPTSLVSAPV